MVRARSATVPALLLVLVTAGCVSSTPSSAAVQTRATLTLSVTRPVADEPFAATGRVSTRFQRPVVLRVLEGGRWQVAARGTTARSGAYRLAGLSTVVPRRYSVLVPRAEHAGRTYSEVATARRLVRPVRQVGRLEVLPQVAQRGRVRAAAARARNVVVARFTPARPGRAVTFRKRLPGGRWVSAGRTSQRADGTAYLLAASRQGGRAYEFQATAAARAGVPAVRTGTGTDRWTRTFSDEFGGSSLDRDKWSYRVGTAPSRSRSTNDRRAVDVAGGTLRMRVKRDPASPRRFLNAQVSTEDTFSFTYGVASARIRFARGRGQHGSFWLQSPTYGVHPGDPARSGAEVDVVEFFGKGYPGGGLGNFVFHQARDGSSVKTGGVWPRAGALIPGGDTWWNSFHVYSVNWTPTGYTFYVDGKVLYTTRRSLSRTDEYLILSLLTSDWELPDFRFRGAGTMSVDWARVWQSPATG